MNQAICPSFDGADVGEDRGRAREGRKDQDVRDRLAALEAPQTRVIKRDSCEQLNETISRRRGTHGIAEG